MPREEESDLAAKKDTVSVDGRREKCYNIEDKNCRRESVYDKI